MFIDCVYLFQFDSKVHYELRMVIAYMIWLRIVLIIPQTLLKIVGFGVMFTIGLKHNLEIPLISLTWIT